MKNIPGIQPIRYCGLAVAACSAVALVAGITLTRPALWHPAAVALAVALAVGVGAIAALRGYQFTIWIIASVLAAMLYPVGVVHWGPLDLGNKLVLLITIQLVMFGMGTQMQLRDFIGVARMPRGVIAGLIAQFSIMPIVGFTLTKVFHFPPEISAGIVLIGSCSSGLASNVMTYLAGANLALSVTLTTCGTMLAPLITPLWMKFLAGAYVRVDVFAMMLEIVKIVLVPVGAALLHDYLKFASTRARTAIYVTGAVGGAYLAWIGLTSAQAQGTAAVLVGFLFAAVITAIVYHHLAAVLPWLDGMMPGVSMFGIVAVIAATTAAGRDHLLAVGAMLFVAAAMHNSIGYGLGYGLARAFGLGKTDARTIAIEVGLHNGGMASGIAAAMGKLGTVGLASAIFSPWMNVSGSILANYWRKRPVAPPVQQPTEEPEPEMAGEFEVIQPAAPAADAVRTA